MIDREKASRTVARLKQRSHHFLNIAEGEADGELMRSAYCLIEDLFDQIDQTASNGKTGDECKT